MSGDFPGGPGVKNLPANAEDIGSNWSGKIPRASGQLTREPQLLSPCAWSPCSATRGATAMRSLGPTTREGPLLAATRERDPVQPQINKS